MIDMLLVAYTAVKEDDKSSFISVALSKLVTFAIATKCSPDVNNLKVNVLDFTVMMADNSVGQLSIAGP